MKLLVIRHAPAEDRLQYALLGQEDELRPLTEEGRLRMRRAAKGLASIAPRPDRLLASPLVRARQTAEIVANAFGKLTVTEEEALAPGVGPRKVLSRLASLGDSPELCLAIVGHEPDLGELVGAALGARGAEAFPFKKGGAALLEFPETPKPGAAQLRWLLPPGMLRALAEA
ncbi:MAG: phosphohistidine phosphatase SixA [Halothiobacillaceae bacterium]|mgnify:CR=1 FL=1|jgi:phosphohistidine phosphatase|nr:phosphohistidine phosphatase SixA [Halothiobacillaceae bacterium]MDY0049110.1 phosphohistidine phosphatase SixA [Halothiobacillaceae bacterium]